VQIAEVSSLDGEDSSEEAGSAYQEAADAAHALLLAMCTDPSHGLAGASAVEELDMDEGALGSGAGSNPAGDAILLQRIQQRFERYITSSIPIACLGMQ